MKLKKLLNLNENKSISDLNSREYGMIVGIIDILNKVRDLDNRKEIAVNQIQNFKKEGIVFDYTEFMKKLGLD
jgi:Ethanolamine utilization protein EutJ (predicted chaperonin)